MDLVSAFREAFRKAGGKPGRLGRRHFLALERIWRGRLRKTVLLPGNLPARGTPRGVLVGGARPGPSDPLPETVLAVPGRTLVGEWVFQVDPCPVPDPGSLAREGEGRVEFVDRDALSFPLIARSRAPGDRFHPLGAPGGTRLKEFLRASGIPPEERNGLPLVVDGKGRILWVVTRRIAHWARITPKTREAIRLEALREP